MQHAEYVYYAALALAVIPSAPFNRVAGVVAALWLLAHAAIMAGAPACPVQAAQHVLGLALALSVARTWPCHLAAALYLPIAATDILALLGALSATHAWDWVLVLSLAQAAIVPFGNDWAAVREGLRAVRDLAWLDSLMRVRAWTS